jgi:hypothetical protein
LLLPCCCIWLSGLGFQDLNFQDLNKQLSKPGFQDSDRRTQRILRSSHLFLVTFLCIHRHFSFSRHFSLCVQWSQKDCIQWSQTHRLSDFI